MITAAVMSTKNRRAQAARCAEMFRATVRRRPFEFIVFDQTPGAEPYPGCRFAGEREVDRYIGELSSFGLPHDVLRYALVGDYGGYRNAALLDTIGQKVLSVDDDTEPLMSPPPGQRGEKLCYSHNGEKPGTWWFASRKEWKDALPAEQDGMLEKHEALLGGTTMDGYVVPVTMAGILGDSAATHNHFAYLAGGAERKRVMEDWPALSRTREIMQAYDTMVVTRDPFLRTVSFGYDNRYELPPFMPRGRGECGVFGHLLVQAHPKACIGHIPWAIHHVPVARFGYHACPVIGVPEVIGAMVESIGRQPLGIIGHELCAFDDLSMQEAREFIRVCQERSVASLRTALEARLREYDEPEAWVSDTCALLLELHNAPAVTDDLAIELKREVAAFGRLLQIWPTVYSAARALLERGVRVSREVPR